jgi:hypothetical protein
MGYRPSGAAGDAGERVPRSARDWPHTQSIVQWKAAYQRRAQAVSNVPETLISSWLAVRQWPACLRHYAFRKPIDHGRSKSVLAGLRCPAYPHRRGFLGFGAIDDYAPDLSTAFAVTAVRESPTIVSLGVV